MESATELLAAKSAFYAAFNKAQSSVQAVKTDSKNPHFGSNYASLTAVVAALKPFIDGGFSIIQGGVDINGKPYMRTKVAYSKSGWEEVFDYPLIVNDANPQHLASATTYARRYALVAFFGLCVEDDDGNAAATPAKTSAAVQKTFGKSAERTSEPVPSGDILEIVSTIDDVDTKTGEGAKGPWTKFSVKIGTKYYSSFDEKVGELLNQEAGTGKKVRILYKQEGKYNNITKVTYPAVEKELEEVPF